MSKYLIDNFYVGELFFSCLVNGSKESLDKLIRGQKQYSKAIGNGAIELNNGCFDVNGKRYYNEIFTLFYKSSYGKTICLHNGMECSGLNLVPLKSCLPKYDYDIPKLVSFKEALELFDRLFNLNCYFSHFYSGYLNLCTKLHMLNSDGIEIKSRLLNVADYCSLNSSEANLVGMFSLEGKKLDNTYIYDYDIYKCLYLRRENQKVYNLNNYQIYDKGILRDEDYKDIVPGDSYYDNMVPLFSKFEKNDINWDKKMISIPRVLSLQRKMYCK